MTNHLHKNHSLNRAKKRINDEFYTPLNEIARVFDTTPACIFKNQSLLLPCDDYRHSQFYRYFKDRFHQFGLSRLQAVAYRENDKGIFCEYNGESEKVELLLGNGDFRLDETQSLIEQADVVITNPPYSLIRTLFQNLIEKEKKFLLIAPINALHYIQVFPFIKSGEIKTSYFDIRHFIQPDGTRASPARSIWMGNLMDFEKPFLPCTYSINDYHYDEYNNIQALEIPYARMIPYDYDGVMGVPATFLSKINCKQFEILALDSEIYRKFSQLMKTWNVKHRKDKPYYQGKMCYSRVFIRHKAPLQKESCHKF